MAHRVTRTLLSLSLLAFLISCAVPFGPSYTIEKQSLKVHFVAHPEAHLEIEAHFELMASGTQPVYAIEIKLPDERSFPAQNLHTSLDGREVSFAPQETFSNPSLGVDSRRIRFDSPWRPKERHTLIVQYAAAPSSGMPSPVHAAGFFAGGNWYPTLVPPKGAFAKLAMEFNKWDLEIHVPESFLVHARGRVRNSKIENGEIALRVQQRVDDIPFIVAGQYREQVVSSPKNQIIFWTLQPLAADAAREAGMQIAYVTAAYERMFGARFDPRNKSKGPATIWIVECPSAGERSIPTGSLNANEPGDRACNISLPDTVLMTSLPSANGVTNKSFHQDVNLALAYLWLGHPAPLNPAPADFVFDGLYVYAAHAVLDEPGAANLRNKFIAAYLAAYDKKLQQQEEQTKTIQPPAASHTSSPIPRRDPPFEKSVLFFLALEDQYGRAHLHRAIARVIYALGEQGYNRNDLRSALESETKQDAAVFFRSWLDEFGIPKNFRARYESNGTPAGDFSKEKP